MIAEPPVAQAFLPVFRVCFKAEKHRQECLCYRRRAEMCKPHRFALAAACGIGFASSANYTNHAPMVTALAAEFGFKLAAAGLLTTGVFLTHGGMQIPGGYLADRLGPKPVLSIALAIVCLGKIALGLATSYRKP